MVTCDTRATRDDLVERNLLSPDQLVVVHNGVHPAMLAGDDADGRAEISRLAGPPRGDELLHVGSTIARKRIDVLIEAFAVARRRRPSLTLLRAGGPLTEEQRGLAARLGVTDAIVDLPVLTPRALAALYRRAIITLLPSDLEGFGLPVIESLASGTPVLASRIGALVEVGGSAVAYAEPGKAASWSEAIDRLLAEREQEPGWWAYRREQGRRHAAAFSWFEHARGVGEVYRRVAAQAGHPTAVT
jgi:glycosyltransferase involved in cell wall biosynthesis